MIILFNFKFYFPNDVIGVVILRITINLSVCVCVCVCEGERERERESDVCIFFAYGHFLW